MSQGGASPTVSHPLALFTLRRHATVTLSSTRFTFFLLQLWGLIRKKYNFDSRDAKLTILHRILFLFLHLRLSKMFLNDLYRCIRYTLSTGVNVNCTWDTERDFGLYLVDKLLPTSRCPRSPHSVTLDDEEKGEAASSLSPSPSPSSSPRRSSETRNVRPTWERRKVLEKKKKISRHVDPTPAPPPFRGRGFTSQVNWVRPQISPTSSQSLSF